MTAEPEVYVVERIREALAHDPRVAELGIGVTVTGDKVLLTGDVATTDRRAAVEEVVAPLADGRVVHNVIGVVPVSEVPPEDREMIP